MRSVIGCLTLILITILFSCEKDKKNLPVLTTHQVWNIMQRTAVSGGDVLDDGGESIVARGICWDKSHSPTIRNNRTIETGGTGSFMSNLNGLTPGTIYYVRAYATNKFGTGYGNEVAFESGPVQTAEVSTDWVTSIKTNAAVSGGTVNYDGGGSEITSKGVCWSESINPTLNNPHTQDGSGTEHFISQLSGLSGNTTYYVRAYAVNSVGTAYGNELSFKTFSDSAGAVLFGPIMFNPGLTYGSVTDVDMNVYKTIRIGSQIWMAENLKTTNFNNGAQIAYLTDNSLWEDYTLDAFTWYNNDPAFKTSHGALYNWYAVNTGILCPIEWHIPSYEELTELIAFLGGEIASAGKLKESGTSHWLSPNTDSDNFSGFSALPGGYLYSGTFTSFRESGSWWSSEGSNPDSAYIITLSGNNGPAKIASGIKTNGLSVRCVKN